LNWIRIDRVTWAERALWTALVAAAIAPVALKPSIDEVARAYVDAINRGDVDAALAVTASEIVIRPFLGSEHRGAEGARQVLEYRAALNERWRVFSWEDTGKEVHAGVEVTNDAWVLLGAHPRMTVILVVRNGVLMYELARTEHRPIRRALRPFLRWAEEERSVELGAVWRDGELVWHAEAASPLLALLREWRAAESGVADQPSRGQG
jgi:hypothetical protein